MNKLEYINGKIDFYKERLATIKNCKKVCVREDQLEELSKEETFYTEILQTSKQIKAELEAWEVVRQRLKIGSFITMDRISKDHSSYRTIEKVLINKTKKK